jgi:bacteriocin biosynthesis cyclodehydratase domain-containing protein
MFPDPERDGQPPERPHLKPWFRWALAGDDVVVEHGHTAHVFSGRAATTLLPGLLPLLDGTRTAADVAAALELGPDAILAAVGVLDELGLLLDGEQDAAAADAAVRALAASGLHDPAEVRAALERAEVAIVGDAPAGEAVEELLRASGVAVASRCDWDAAARLPERAPAAFVVAAPAPEEVPRLDRWNAEAVAAGGPVWLQVLPYDGRIAVVGPVIVPGETCCRACFVRRRAAASGYGLEFDALELVPTRAGGGPALDAVVAGVAATTTLRWLVHGDASLPGVFRACERSGLALTEHRVLRVPRCPVCSEVRDLATPLPWFKEPGAEIPTGAVGAVR